MEITNEIFKGLEGHENYVLSNQGYVMHVDTLRKFKMSIQKQSGFLKFNVGNCSYMIHKLVADAFIANPENLPCVRHIDKNKNNNTVDNLQWSKWRPEKKQVKSDIILDDFKPIKDHESYLISKNGVVFDVENKAIIKLWHDKDNGEYTFRCDKKLKRLHRVLAETFLNKGPLDYFVIHNDKNKNNNNLNNLSWVEKL